MAIASTPLQRFLDDILKAVVVVDLDNEQAPIQIFGLINFSTS